MMLMNWFGICLNLVNTLQKMVMCISCWTVMRHNIPDGGKYYGNSSVHLSKKNSIGFYSLISHLHRMLLLGKARKDLEDVLCAR